MSRRASSSFPISKLLIVVAIVAGLIAGGVMFLNRTRDSGGPSAIFPVKDYLENANSLRGNNYKLEATVDSTLEVLQGVGRLFSVETSGDMLPVFVPAALNGTNVERGQKLKFRVYVTETGLIRADDIRKP
jgi:hypothetical protein